MTPQESSVTNSSNKTMSKQVTSLLALAAMGVGLIAWGNSNGVTASDSSRSLLNVQHVQPKTAAASTHHDVLHVSREHLQVETHSNSHASKNSWMVGLMSDASAMTKDTFDFMMEFHCSMGANIHFLVESGAVTLNKKRTLYIEANPSSCANSNEAAFHVVTQSSEVRTQFPNRIDRLAYLRDVQRDSLRELTNAKANAVDAIIVLDGDLHSVPHARFVQDQLNEMLASGDDANAFDVVCATGVNHDQDQFAYYDTFATVLQPDTWVYPLKARLDEELQGEENTDLIVETGITNVELLQYIQSHATTALNANSDQESLFSNVLPVKSCFGGMALYKASTWFETECKYSALDSSVYPNMPSVLRQYANKDDQRTCEHVTFHQCLQNENQDSVKIALHPLLVTEYHDVAPVYTQESRSLEQDLMSVTSFFIAPIDLGLDNSTSASPVSNFTIDNTSTSADPNDLLELNPQAVEEDKGVPCTCMFSMELMTDYFGYETSYELLNIQTGETVLEGSNLGSTMTYNAPADFCLEEGQYIFYVRDSYGDGMFDPGFYNVDVCGGGFTRTGGGSDDRWYVERTVFHVDADGQAQLPPPPEPFEDGTLMARTSASACAENMGWGNTEDFKLSVAGTDGFMCTDCAVNRHSQWMQIFYDLDVELMRILWEFESPKSLSNRFETAVTTGENVKWTIQEPNAGGVEHVRSGVWRWSTGSGGWPTSAASASSGFSIDDGAWGGADGMVNGDGYNDVPAGFWGQGNFNGGDGNCGNYYRDGVAMDLEMNALWSEIYAVSGLGLAASLAPAPTPAPTESPTMAPTMTPDCQFEFILRTDGWGGETSWKLERIDGGGDGTSEGQPTGSYNKNRQYSFVKCLEPGTYEFTIMDTAKDGMFPPGGFDLYLGGNHLKSGGGKGGFTEKESVTFDIANDDLF